MKPPASIIMNSPSHSHSSRSLCDVSTNSDNENNSNNSSNNNMASNPVFFTNFLSSNLNARVISPIPMRPIRPAAVPPSVLQIRDSDIICGRGSGASAHKGNVVFRKMIAQVQHYYHYANAVGKAELSKRIVNLLLADGSRFLRRVEGANDPFQLDQSSWEELDAKAAREKVCQALREKRAAFDEPNFHQDCSPGSATESLFGILQLSNASLASLTSSQHETSSYPTTSVAPTDSCRSNNTNKTTTLESASSSTTTSTYDFVIGPNDVLLGRGGVTNCWSGNKRFRTLVHDHQLKYLGAPKGQKGAIARQIVDLVHSRGGRFLEDAQGTWICAKDKAIEKTKQALREKGPEMKRIYRAAVNLVRTAHSNSN